MSVRIPDFYLFPAFGGPSLAAQYPTLRNSFGWLNAAMRNSYIDESTNLTTHAFNALAYGELMQRFKFRWRYDATNDEFQLQQNSTDNEANPTWTTLIKIRESDGRVTIVSPGGLLAIGGFYNLGGLDVGVTQLGGGAFGNVGTLLFDSNSGFYLSADSSGRPIVSVNAAALAGVLTDLANAGGGAQVFQSKVVSTAHLRSIIGGTNVTVQQNPNDITISSSAPSGEVNTASNLGSGFGIWFDKQGVDLRFKSLVGVDGVNISANSSEIRISAPEFYLEVRESEAGGYHKRTDKLTFSTEFYVGSAGDGSPLISLSAQAVSNSTISNLGAGTGVFAQKVVDDFQLKSLIAGTNITITPTATDLTIAATAPDSSTASNLGAGDGVFAQQVADDLQFKTLIAGTNITITPTATDLTIDASGGGSSPVTALRALASDASGLPVAATTTAAELDYVSGVTSAIQTQLGTKITSGAASIVNADVDAAAAITRTKLAAGTASRLVINVPTTGVIGEAAAITSSRALVSDADGIPVAATPTTTELNYLSGVTSGIQAQINAVSSGGIPAGTGAIVDADVNAAAAIARSKLAAGAFNRVVVSGAAGVMADAAAITPSRALASDANGLPVAATPTTTELNYLSGVTSGIQAQIAAAGGGIPAGTGAIVNADVNASAAIARTKLATGTADRLVVNAPSTGAMAEAAAITASRALVSDASGIPVAATPTTTEINYVAGVTSLIQTQLGTKITSGGGTIVNADVNASAAIARTKLAAGTGNRLVVNAVTTGIMTDAPAITASKALVSNTSGIPTASTVSTTELGYLEFVTSGVQNQLNALGPLKVLNEATKTANYTILAADAGQAIIANLATPITFALTAGATLGVGFACFVRNINTGLLTIDPNSTETINGLSTLTLRSGQGALIWASTTTAFRALVMTDTTREVLTAARTYYVRTDGSDANGGLANTAGGAFLTMQKGIDTCYTIDQNGFTITIQVGAGTYTAGVSITKAFTGPVILQGDTTTPSNVLISVTNAQGIYVGNKGELQIGGFKIVVTTAGQAFQALFGGKITLTGLMDFGACANVHMYSAYDAQIIVAAPYNITGGAQYHQLATFKSMIYCIGQTITLTGTPAFSVAFAGAQQCSYFQGNGNTYVGSATGPRFDVRQLSMLSSAGGGASYFPGNSVGVTDAATFGVYN